jgi:hypothetical protein
MTLQPVLDTDDQQQSQAASAMKIAAVITLPPSCSNTVLMQATGSAEQSNDSSSSGDSSGNSSSITVIDKSARLAPPLVLAQVAAALREVFAMLQCGDAESDASMFGWTCKLAQPSEYASAAAATVTTAGVTSAGAQCICSDRSGAAADDRRSSGSAADIDDIAAAATVAAEDSPATTATAATVAAVAAAEVSAATAATMSSTQQQQQQCKHRHWRMPTVLMAGPTPQAQCVRSSISVATSAASALLSTLLKLEALTVNRTATSGQRRQYVSTLQIAPVFVNVLGVVLLSLERYLRGRYYCCSSCNASNYSSSSSVDSSQKSEQQQCTATVAATSTASSVECNGCSSSSRCGCEYSVSAAAVGDAYWQFVTAEQRTFVAKLNCVLGSFSTCALYSAEAVSGRRKSYDDALTEVLQFLNSKSAREGFAALSAMQS